MILNETSKKILTLAKRESDFTDIKRVSKSQTDILRDPNQKTILHKGLWTPLTQGQAH